MIGHYLKIAWRNLAKNRFYSIINIAGLSVGVASCILIGIYILNELSYDRFHKNSGRLVRVTVEYTVNGTKSEEGKVGSMAGPRLASAFPEIEDYVRIRNFEPYAVRYNDKIFVEKRFLFADSSFFRMFSFPLTEGNPRDALNGPNKIAITQSMERKYFGDQRALGKILRVGGTTNYIVSAVTKDPPDNSQIHFDFIASYASLPNANFPNWWVHIYTTYFLLKNRRHMVDLERNINAFMRQQKDLQQAGNDYMAFHLEPITSVHLYSPLEGLEPNGNITYIYILAAIALLILCIACVNYTNLSTAQAVQRIPEIGIRKVLGSVRGQIFWQFLGESMILNCTALVLAVFFAILLLPSFDRLIERSLKAGLLLSPAVITMMIVLYIGISVASGIYPAILLARQKLINVLKAGFSFSGSSAGLRKTLIVLQFSISVFLIVSTVIIFQQLSFIRNKNLGYDKDHILVLPVDQVMRNNFKSIKDALLRVPNVANISCGAEEATHIQWDDEVSTMADGSSPMYIHAAPTDIDFVQTMGLNIISGSDFTQSDWMQMYPQNNMNPHTSYMLNESAVKALGWAPEEAIGKTLYRGTHKGIVKAVLKDFHFEPLQQPISPLVVFLDSQYVHVFQAFVKISGRNVPHTLQSLSDAWKEWVPHRPFQFHFLNENYDALYHNERQTAKIFTTFSGLAILLACLGLFALAAYTTIRRTKEIGIRKVLGAGALRIVMLVSGDFLKLVVLGSFVAIPIGWIFMSHWLQSFAYRINIQAWVFVLACASALLIALAAISFQAIKAAVANPVKSLRTE